MPLSPGSAQMECEVASHQVDSAGDRCSSLKLKELWSCRGCRCQPFWKVNVWGIKTSRTACTKLQQTILLFLAKLLPGYLVERDDSNLSMKLAPCSSSLWHSFQNTVFVDKGCFSENGTRTYLLLKTPEANALSLTYVLSRLSHVSNGVGGTATQIEQLAFYMSFSYSWHLHLLQEIHDRCKSLLAYQASSN